MYLKLNNYEYKITAANVGFEMSEDNKSLIMFLDIDGSYEGEESFLRKLERITAKKFTEKMEGQE